MLEDILAPVKAVDEIVHREVTRKVMDFESHGRSRYSVALGLVLVNQGIALANKMYDSATQHTVQYPAIQSTEGVLFYGAVLGLVGTMLHDIIYTSWKFGNHRAGDDEDIAAGERVVDSFSYYSTKFQRVARLPMLAFAAKAGYDGIVMMLDSNYSFHSTTAAFYVGTTCLLTAISMYVKDSDPKVLDKKPMWKSAWERVVGFYDLVKPQPVMVPNMVPIQQREVLC